MDLIKICIVMAVLIAALKLHLKLWQAVICCIISTVLLFGIHIRDAAFLVVKGATSWSNLSILLMLYFITFWRSGHSSGSPRRI